MNSKELIELLLQNDPTGEKEVLVKCEDGYAYSIFSRATLNDCEEGILSEGTECLVLETL